MEWIAFEAQWRSFLVTGFIHLAVSKLIRYFNLNHLRQITILVVGFGACFHLCGFFNSALMIVENIFIYNLMKVTKMPVPIAWFFGILHMVIPAHLFFVAQSPIYSGNSMSYVYAMWAWMWNVMRYVSFAHEWQWTIDKQKETKEEQQTESEMQFRLIDFLAFFFYHPTTFASIITYKHFHDQALVPFKVPQTKSQFSLDRFGKLVATVAFWCLFVHVWGECFMHYSMEQSNVPPNYFPLKDLDDFGAGIISKTIGSFF